MLDLARNLPEPEWDAFEQRVQQIRKAGIGFGDGAECQFPCQWAVSCRGRRNGASCTPETRQRSSEGECCRVLPPFLVIALQRKPPMFRQVLLYVLTYAGPVGCKPLHP